MITNKFLFKFLTVHIFNENTGERLSAVIPVVMTRCNYFAAHLDPAQGVIVRKAIRFSGGSRAPDE
jgi:hypothetical protein